MAILTSGKRNALKKSTFGLPGERKYPMPNPSHAANAKARATQQVKAGNLSAGQKATIDAKANRILGEHGNKPKRQTTTAVDSDRGRFGMKTND